MARRKSRILNIQIKAKKVFVFVLALTAVAFLLSIPQVANAVAPVIKQDGSLVAMWGDRIFTIGVAVIFAMLAIATLTTPLLALLLGIHALAVGYHAFKKFRK